MLRLDIQTDRHRDRQTDRQTDDVTECEYRTETVDSGATVVTTRLEVGRVLTV